jgi:hypothetical protein
MDLHVETARPLGDCLADAAHAEYAEPFAGEVRAQHPGRRPTRPCPFAHHALAFVGAAGSAQQKQHGDVGGGVSQHIGRVGDDNAAGLGGCGVDMLVTDRKGGNDFDRAGQCFNHGGRQLVGWAGQQGIGSLGHPSQLLAAIEAIAEIEAWLVIAPQTFMNRFGELACDEDDGFFGHFVRFCYLVSAGKKRKKRARRYYRH